MKMDGIMELYFNFIIILIQSVITTIRQNDELKLNVYYLLLVDSITWDFRESRSNPKG